MFDPFDTYILTEAAVVALMATVTILTIFAAALGVG